MMGSLIAGCVFAAAYGWCCGTAFGRFISRVVASTRHWSLARRRLAAPVIFAPLVMSLWPSWKLRAAAWAIYAVAYVWIGPGRYWRKKLAKRAASSLTEVQAAMLQREVRASA